MTTTPLRAPSRGRTWAAFLLLGALMGPMGTASASTPPPSTPEVLTLSEAARLLRIGSDELKQLALRNKVPSRRIGSHWRFNRAALMAWLNGDWKLITTAVPPDTRALGPRTMGRVSGTGANVAQSEATPPTGEKTPAKSKDTSQDPIGEAPEERTAEDVFLRGQKVLLGPGEVTVDFGQFYSQSESQVLASVGGGVGLATVEQETLTTLFLGRVGVFDETELFASTTFVDQDNDVFFGSRKIADSGRTEFGDVRVGVRRTLMKEGPGLPDIIATVDGRIPTGDTSWAVGGGLALVKSIDPVVLFANANYRHTFSRDFADVTRLEPEDRLDVSMGYALALNDTLTLSTSVSGLFTSATRFENAELRQRDSFSMSFGLTSWLAEGIYIEPSVSFGLSGPGDSYVLGVTVPYTF